VRLAPFGVGEFFVIITMSALAACLFLGGWQIPWVDTPLNADGSVAYGWLTVLQVLAMVVKTTLMVFIFQQIRWTFPRFRYDQLMRLGWVYMLPLAIANLASTALVMFLLR